MSENEIVAYEVLLGAFAALHDDEKTTEESHGVLHDVQAILSELIGVSLQIGLPLSPVAIPTAAVETLPESLSEKVSTLQTVYGEDDANLTTFLSVVAGLLALLNENGVKVTFELNEDGINIIFEAIIEDGGDDTGDDKREYKPAI